MRRNSSNSNTVNEWGPGKILTQIFKITRCVNSAMRHALQPPSGGGPGSNVSLVRTLDRVRDSVLVSAFCFCDGEADFVGFSSFSFSLGIAGGGVWLASRSWSRSRLDLSCIVEAVDEGGGDDGRCGEGVEVGVVRDGDGDFSSIIFDLLLMVAVGVDSGRIMTVLDTRLCPRFVTVSTSNKHPTLFPPDRT